MEYKYKYNLTNSGDPISEIYEHCLRITLSTFVCQCWVLGVYRIRGNITRQLANLFFFYLCIWISGCPQLVEIYLSAYLPPRFAKDTFLRYAMPLKPAMFYGFYRLTILEEIDWLHPVPTAIGVAIVYWWNVAKVVTIWMIGYFME